MLAYQHAFHAGNHADVLKHLVLVQVLEHLLAKPKPLMMIDTHAGAGRYRLGAEGEHLDGIARLWTPTGSGSNAPAAVKRYLSLVAAANAKGALRLYPGSPLLAQQLLRSQDALRLFELHPAEVRLLARQIVGPQVEVHRSDGFGALKALLPPPSRRALVLMDPPYEMRADYALVVASLRDALKRFADGVYLLWYPMVARLEARQLPERLKKLAPKSWLHASLRVAAADARGVGLIGSGVFVFNPPWTLHAALAESLPWLCARLAQIESASWALDHHEA